MTSPTADLMRILVEKTRGFADCPECAGRGWILEAGELVNRCYLCQKRKPSGAAEEPLPPLDCDPF